MLKTRIDSIVDGITPALVALRRQIHEYPELAFEEVRTSALVAERLKGIGIEPKSGIGKTGVVGLVKGGKPGMTLGIRADMDALPVTEATNLPFASKVPGKMHACGHDAHTVIALGVAEVLHQLWSEVPGTVKFIFQPAEETLVGAQAMIADGVLNDPKMDVILGYHNWPLLDAGKVGYHPTVIMASSDAFDITITGKSGHAAHPHTAVDTVVATAHIITMLQTIVSREVAPVVPAVVTVGQVIGGTVRNVIAGSVTLKGTVRALDFAASGQIEAAMRRILDGVCRACASATSWIGSAWRRSCATTRTSCSRPWRRRARFWATSSSCRCRRHRWAARISRGSPSRSRRRTYASARASTGSPARCTTPITIATTWRSRPACAPSPMRRSS